MVGAHPTHLVYSSFDLEIEDADVLFLTVCNLAIIWRGIMIRDEKMGNLKTALAPGSIKEPHKLHFAFTKLAR